MSLIDDAIARLPHQYRGTPEAPSNEERILRAVLAPLVETAEAIGAILAMTVDNERGVWLDDDGELVGRPRNGVTDDESYRRYVRAQIATNQSDGLIDDVLKVADLVIGDSAATLALRNEGAAAYTLEVGGVALPDTVARVVIELMIKATTGGVRPVLQYAISPPAQVYRLDVGPGLDVGNYATTIDHT